LKNFSVFSHCATAPSGPGPPHYRGFKITFRYIHNNRQDFPGRVIGPSQRPLPDNTKYSQDRETSMPQAGFEPAMKASGRKPMP
jgi:hypothetical protein